MSSSPDPRTPQRCAPDNPPPPFVLGVTGKIDLPGYLPGPEGATELTPAIRAMRARVLAILDWIRSPRGALDPVRGTFDAEGASREPFWNARDRVPVQVLTSLAPGADTLVAEAALDLAERVGPGRILVRAPLP
ncbi:MAG TPA: hypothetical protein ENJ09_14025, partial [Planctomycetes bacterium]|nr:hypothetical protein [Planctomycetota bacterium]